MVDAILKRPRSDLGDWSLQYCNRKRPATYGRGTGDRRRWEIAVLPGENWAAISQTDKVFELLKPCVGPEDVELERVAVYCFHSDALAVDRRGLGSPHPAVLGTGHVRRHARRRQPRVEAWARAAGPERRLLARHLPDGARTACVGIYRTRGAAGGLINTRAMKAAVPDAVIEGGSRRG